MSYSELEKWADSRNTSIEIARSIFEVGNDMDRIWQDPTSEEKAQIIKRAFAKTDDNELFWGVDSITRPSDKKTKTLKRGTK